MISALCSINGSKPIRTDVFVQEITYRLDGASGGAPVSKDKISDVVETMYVSEKKRRKFF